MQRSTIRSVAVVGALTVFGCAPPPGVPNSPGAPAATQPSSHPVADFFLAGVEAFNRHELDQFMRQFAQDIEMYTPTGWLRGRAAVRERFASTFQQVCAHGG